MSFVKYEICVRCDHFVEENTDSGPGIAEYLHLDDGEKEHNHDAEPKPNTCLYLDSWRAIRPELFFKHRDGRIGPNSRFHVTRWIPPRITERKIINAR